MTFARVAFGVAMKDLRIELTGRYALGTVLPFACTQLVAFGLSLGPGRSLLEETAPAVLWLAVLFAAVLAFRGAYEAEGDDGALEGLLLAPVDKAAVFAGKAAAVMAQLIPLAIVLALLTEVLFGVGPRAGLPALPALLATLTLGAAGLAGVGSLFGVLTEAAKAREAVFPLLVLPLTTPVLLAAIRATALIQAGSQSEAAAWLGLLAAFDVIFLAAGAALFGHLMED